MDTRFKTLSPNSLPLHPALLNMEEARHHFCEEAGGKTVETCSVVRWVSACFQRPVQIWCIMRRTAAALYSTSMSKYPSWETATISVSVHPLCSTVRVYSGPGFSVCLQCVTTRDHKHQALLHWKRSSAILGMDSESGVWDSKWKPQNHFNDTVKYGLGGGPVQQAKVQVQLLCWVIRSMFQLIPGLLDVFKVPPIDGV